MASIDCFVVERVNGSRGLWRRPDTGEEFDHRSIPAGAVWEAEWMGDSFRVNGDGPVLVVRLPDGRDWMPGSRAGNCPKERGVDHDCWCVHGEAPNLHVDKVPVEGRSTCTAGAGSIGPRDDEFGWHGFLHDGQLVDV